jgi:hypothetical protein
MGNKLQSEEIVMKGRFASSHSVLWLMVFSILLSACSGASQNQNQTQTKAPERPPVYEGFHDVTNCNGAMGWAWDKNRPGVPIEVELYDGDTLLATVTASDFRQDLLNAGIGNGQHGFTYPIPPRLKDGKPHNLKMKFAGTTMELANTPKNINCVFEQ